MRRAIKVADNVEPLWPTPDVPLHANPPVDAAAQAPWPQREIPEWSIQRARWVLAWPAPSEAELIFLATGEMASSDELGE